MGYFDSAAKTRVITDASPVGLGAILVQEQNGEERVICYASRSLTDAEKRYSETEKGALGIVWACERLHMYSYGTDFERSQAPAVHLLEEVTTQCEGQ